MAGFQTIAYGHLAVDYSSLLMSHELYSMLVSLASLRETGSSVLFCVLYCTDCRPTVLSTWLQIVYSNWVLLGSSLG